MLDSDKKKILDWMQEGYNCSQVVMMHFVDKTGIDLEIAKNISQPFELGHYNASTCGAVVAGLMVLGLLKGGMDDDSKVDLIKSSHIFTSKFKEQMGAINCVDLLGMNVNEGNNISKAFEEGKIQTICPKAIFTAIEILEEMI